MAEYEARISIYRNGRRIDFNDAHGSSPTAALYAAHNDLELAMQRYEEERPREFDPEPGDLEHRDTPTPNILDKT
jgi:hypothetical protein